MADVRQISQWRMATANGAMYERLLGSIGSEEFGATVRDTVMSAIGGVRRIYLFEATNRDHSRLQYYFGEPGLVQLFPSCT